MVFLQETKLALQTHEKQDRPVLFAKWSHTTYPLLGVASSGLLQLFNEEGEVLAASPQISKDTLEPTALCWHPSKALLAVGWEDGSLTLWNELTRKLHTDTTTHKSAVCLLQWSPRGDRLVSGGRQGMFAVLEVKPSGVPMLICQYNKEGAVTHCAFRTSPGKPSEVCPSFFVASASGAIFFADDLGHCSKAAEVGSGLIAMDFCAELDYLLLVTHELFLYVFAFSSEGGLVEKRKDKLSIRGDGSTVEVLSLGGGLVCASSNETSIRFWNLEQDENYVLSLGSECLARCLAFEPSKRLLAAGTQSGQVILLRATNTTGAPSEQDWETVAKLVAPASIFGVSLGTPVSSSTQQHSVLLSVRMRARVSVFHETSLHSACCGSTSIVQQAPDQFIFQSSPTTWKTVLCSVRVKGLTLSATHALVYDGSEGEVFRVQGNDLVLHSKFDKHCFLHGDSLVSSTHDGIQISTLQGVSKAKLPFSHQEGGVRAMDLAAGFVAVITEANTLRFFDLTRLQPRLLVPSRRFPELGEGVRISAVSVNFEGTKLCFSAVKSTRGGEGKPLQCFFVYDVELDQVKQFKLQGFTPVRHRWAQNEPRLLAVESVPLDTSQTFTTVKRTAGEEEKKEVEGCREKPGLALQDTKQSAPTNEVSVFFVTSEHGILLQDSFPINREEADLSAFVVPHVLLLTRSRVGREAPFIEQHTMRDFMGLENVDEATRTDLLDFSFYLAIGNMDAAYRAVKKIKSTAVWENMARMCIKTKRLDVARVCLGNMRNATAARAVRLAMKREPEVDAQVAVLAVQLGMVEEAKKLLRGCGRFDLLTKVLIAAGQWEEALALGEQHDRIHLKSTHFMYGRTLDAEGDTANAVKHLEQSGTHQQEVPYMFFQRGAEGLAQLEKYVNACKDKELIEWWGQYCESTGNFKQALVYYAKAGNVAAQVRVLTTQLHNFEEATKLCHETNDVTACFRLARQFEENDKTEQAIQFYQRAHRFNHAIRLAMEAGLDGELLRMALQAPTASKVAAAEYFEKQGDHEKAVLLFDKAGKSARALELCFAANLFEPLQKIAEKLDHTADPAILTRCAQYFLAHEQFDKAMDMLIRGNQNSEALQLCVDHSIHLTEDFAERLTPARSRNAMEKRRRTEVLMQIAQICDEQGSHKLACRKFTQAGDKVRAVKSLMRTNNTAQIVLYASKAKKAPVYVLVANHLQTLQQWDNPKITGHITTFYTKAGAFDKLSVFFENSAQVAVDEKGDYANALEALRQAQNALMKTDAEEARVEEMGARVRLVEMYFQALNEADSQTKLGLCQQLLSHPDVDASVREADILALMAEQFAESRQFEQAHEALQRMRERGIDLNEYLDPALVQRVCSAMGVPMAEEAPPEEESIGEDILEEYGE